MTLDVNFGVHLKFLDFTLVLHSIIVHGCNCLIKIISPLAMLIVHNSDFPLYVLHGNTLLFITLLLSPYLNDSIHNLIESTAKFSLASKHFGPTVYTFVLVIGKCETGMKRRPRGI